MSPLSLPTKAVTADSKVEIAEDSSEQLSRYRRSAAAFSRRTAAVNSAVSGMSRVSPLCVSSSVNVCDRCAKVL